MALPRLTLTNFGRAAAALLAFALLLISVLPARDAQAADLPYQAFGSGLKAGQTVEALNGTVSMGKVTVDAGGNWVMQLPADKAANGAVITFTIDGAAAKETVTFQAGGFTPLPGLALTLAAAATPTPTPTATPAPGLTVGAFAAPPLFGTNGQAQVVFGGGSVDQLVTASTGANASGVWVQDSSGNFQLLIIGGPAFTLDAFKSKFATGFSGAIAVTLTKAG